MNPRLIQGAALTAAAAAVLYVAASFAVGGRAVADALDQVGWPTLVVALCLSLVNYALRCMRWRGYLAALGVKLDWETAEAIYVSGFAFTATPGKAGELMRGAFLKREGATFLVATAAFLTERLSDLVGIVLVALPGAASQPRGAIIVGLGIALIAALGLTLSQGALLGRIHARLQDAPLPLAGKFSALLSLLIVARRCHRPAAFARATALSLAAWAAEAIAFYIVLLRLGVDIGPTAAMSIYALGAIAGALSFLPGGIGGTEAVMTGLLIASGAPEAKALAATLVIRLATLWYAVAIGALAIAINRRRFGAEIRAAAA
jgi:uncharacterized membrane protein YbhN (UPF0104 family)